MLGVKTLIIDRENRIGDSWRNRYHQLVLHDPVWFDHLPYLPFPESWPIFTPKDKLGDWFESYVKLLELNVWTQTNIVKSSWDDASGKWTITVDRAKDGKIQTRVLHPKVVYCMLSSHTIMLIFNSTSFKPQDTAESLIFLPILRDYPPSKAPD
jgi:cation diffusion facilitator CzcD-associated flavoprotein CzcO